MPCGYLEFLEYKCAARHIYMTQYFRVVLMLPAICLVDMPCGYLQFLDYKYSV